MITIDAVPLIRHFPQEKTKLSHTLVKGIMCSRLTEKAASRIYGEIKDGDVCIKCKEVPATINIRYAIYCRACFLDQTFQKFKVAVGKSRKDGFKGAESIALYCPDTSAASRLLVHFSQLPAIEDPNRRNLSSYTVILPAFTEVDVVVMEAFAGEMKEKYPNLQAIQVIPLYKIYSDDSTTAWTRLDELFAGLSSTSREDLSSLFALRLLLSFIKEIGLDKVYFPDTSTFTAIQIIAKTSKGRGALLPWESGLVQEYASAGISVIRPMREISDREVTIYTAEADLTVEESTVPEFTPNPAMSIDELTGAFIRNLEADYPGTSSTVIRTSGKIDTAARNYTGNGKECGYCCGPVPESTLLCYSCKALKTECQERNKLGLLPPLFQ